MDLPFVSVQKYEHGLHLVSDVFCGEPARFHVLSHNRNALLVDRLCPVIVFSCPWMLEKLDGTNTSARAQSADCDL